MYQGADRHSNNAGELTALLRAVQEERHEQGRVTFVVDSTYAINMVLAAVAKDGYALGFASEQPKADREVVLAAVAQTGHALGAAICIGAAGSRSRVHAPSRKTATR